MFCCIHDPGMSLYRAETRADDETAPGALGWIALGGTVLLAALALAIPA